MMNSTTLLPYLLSISIFHASNKSLKLGCYFVFLYHNDTSVSFIMIILVFYYHYETKKISFVESPIAIL